MSTNTPYAPYRISLTPNDVANEVLVRAKIGIDGEVRTISKTVKSEENTFLEFDKEDLEKLCIEEGERFSLEIGGVGEENGNANHILFKRLVPVDIDFHEFDTETLQLLVAENAKQGSTVDETIGDILKKALPAGDDLEKTTIVVEEANKEITADNSTEAVIEDEKDDLSIPEAGAGTVFKTVQSRTDYFIEITEADREYLGFDEEVPLQHEMDENGLITLSEHPHITFDAKELDRSVLLYVLEKSVELKQSCEKTLVSLLKDAIEHYEGKDKK